MQWRLNRRSFLVGDVNRRHLLERVRQVLAWSGFFLSNPLETRSTGFDLVARRDKTLLVVKVLTNVDSFGRKSAREMGLVAGALEAAPLLVGVKSGGGSLESGVIYARFGIPIVSQETFEDFFLEGVPPFVFSAPGGLYVRLDEEVLRRARERRGVSLGMLAEIAGVSRRAIQMYQEGMGATIDTAVRLETFLGEPVVKPADPLAYALETDRPDPEVEPELEAFERNVYRWLRSLGYEVTRTAHSPFDALTQDATSMLLTGLETSAGDLRTKARIVGNLSRVVEREGVIFVQKRRIRVNVEGTPLIAKDELRKAKRRGEIVELISERKE